MQTTLECLEIETGPNPVASVILLHGLGASGHDFQPIVPELKLPADCPMRFIFPHAPAIPVTINGGMVMPAWYDILELSLERKIDLDQLLVSAAAARQLIDREIERGIDSQKIVMAGFSQGGAVAYQTALTYPRPLAGLLTMSTYFMTAATIEPDKANADIPVMVMHGLYDGMVPEQKGREARAALSEMGYSVSYKTYPAEHHLCLEQIADISHWLQGVVV